MCSNYRPSTREQLQQHFQAAPPDADYPAEAYPGSMAPILRRTPGESEAGARSAANAMFGMVPHWADIKLSRQTYNARTETVANKPSFRNAYKRSQFCVIPAASIYEPSYESGKAVRWEILDADGAPLAVAGIWERREDGPNGLPLLSFSMLTINADTHALMRRFHKPDDEKRMLVLLSPDQVDSWLQCSAENAARFFVPYPAERLTSHAAPRRGLSSGETLPLI